VQMNWQIPNIYREIDLHQISVVLIILNMLMDC